MIRKALLTAVLTLAVIQLGRVALTTATALPAVLAQAAALKGM